MCMISRRGLLMALVVLGRSVDAAYLQWVCDYGIPIRGKALVLDQDIDLRGRHVEIDDCEIEFVTPHVLLLDKETTGHISNCVFRSARAIELDVVSS